MAFRFQFEPGSCCTQHLKHKIRMVFFVVVVLFCAHFIYVSHISCMQLGYSALNFILNSVENVNVSECKLSDWIYGQCFLFLLLLFVMVHEPYRIGKVCACLTTYSISLNHVSWHFMSIQVFVNWQANTPPLYKPLYNERVFRLKWDCSTFPLENCIKVLIEMWSGLFDPLCYFDNRNTKQSFKFQYKYTKWVSIMGIDLVTFTFVKNITSERKRKKERS